MKPSLTIQRVCLADPKRQHIEGADLQRVLPDRMARDQSKAKEKFKRLAPLQRPWQMSYTNRLKPLLVGIGAKSQKAIKIEDANSPVGGLNDSLLLEALQRQVHGEPA